MRSACTSSLKGDLVLAKPLTRLFCELSKGRHPAATNTILLGGQSHRCRKQCQRLPAQKEVPTVRLVLTWP